MLACATCGPSCLVAPGKIYEKTMGFHDGEKCFLDGEDGFEVLRWFGAGENKVFEGFLDVFSALGGWWKTKSPDLEAENFQIRPSTNPKKEKTSSKASGHMIFFTVASLGDFLTSVSGTSSSS